jgi:cobalt-zinc-cadmium efflux system outer membrane protein
VQKAGLENERRRAAVLLEEAKASSDIAVSAGLRHARENGATGVIVGLSVPLPIFDRNQGAILEAQKIAAAGDFDLKSETVRTASDLRDAYEDMAAAIETVRKLKTELLPAAEEGLEMANKAYRLGRLSYLEVLDAQRTYFDAQEEFIKSLTTFHTARARAERLIGRGLDDLAKGQRSDVKSTESTK